MNLSFGGPIYTQRNPDDMPGLTASEDEWRTYRERKAKERGVGGTNNSGMTPQQMESAVAPDPLVELMNMLTSSTGSANGAVIGSYINDQTYTGPATKKDGPITPTARAPTEGESIMQLAFPEIFLKTPPKGVVNTEFGVDRVNARTAEHGTRAIRGPDGKILLTNLGADGTRNKSTGSANSILGSGRGNAISAAPDTPLALSGSLQQLRTAPDLATAQGIMANINETLAQQLGKLQEEALTFAGNRVGLPSLEQELRAAIAADRADPLYVPGMGDSPITAKIRTDIGQANAAATGLATKYLASNTRMGSLKAMEDNSRMMFSSIQRQEEYKQRRDEINSSARSNLDINRELRKEDRIEQEQRKISDEIGNLSPTQLERLAVLDSSVKDLQGNLDNANGQKAAFALKKRNPQKFQEAIDKPLNELPTYAMMGNEYAANIIVADEMKKNPSVTEAQVREKLARVKTAALSLSDSQVEAFQLSQAQNPEQRKQLQETFKFQKTDAILNPPKGDRLKMKEVGKFDIALQMERAAVSKRVLNEAGSLFTLEGPLGAAMMEAQKVTGQRKMADVWTAYKGANSQLGALAIAKQFNEIVKGTINSQPESAFGRPDPQTIMAAIMEEQRSTLLEFIRNSSRSTIGTYFPMTAIPAAVGRAFTDNPESN